MSLLFLRKTNPNIVLAVAAACVMLNEAGAFGIEAYSYEHTVGMSFFFYLGAYYGSAILALIREIARNILLLGPLLMLALRGINYWAVQSFGWQIVGIPERVAAIIFALTGAKWLASRVPAFADPLGWVGRNTMPIYVAHSLLIILGAMIFADMVPEAGIMWATASVVAASLALHRLALWLNLHSLYAIPSSSIKLWETANRRFRQA